MNSEIECLTKNNTWVVIDKPQNKKIIDVMVVLHLKIFRISNFFLLNFLIIYVVSNLKKVVWMKKF